MQFLNNSVCDFVHNVNTWLYSNEETSGNIKVNTSIISYPDPTRCTAIVNNKGQQCSRKKKHGNVCGLHYSRITKFSNDITNFKHKREQIYDMKQFNIIKNIKTDYTITNENGYTYNVIGDHKFDLNGNYIGKM